MPLVFLSYARRDDIFAQLLESRLREAHIRVWRDKDSLYPGEDWKQAIERGISESEAVLVVLSDNSAASAYVTVELTYAFRKKKYVIPIKLTPKIHLHPKLKGTEFVDFSNHDGILSDLYATQWDKITKRLHLLKAKKNMPNFEQQLQAIFDYLNKQHPNDEIEFDRLRKVTNISLNDQEIKDIIQNNEYLFDPAKLSDVNLKISMFKAKHIYI